MFFSQHSVLDSGLPLLFARLLVIFLAGKHLGGYQIILLGGTLCEQLAQNHYLMLQNQNNDLDRTLMLTLTWHLLACYSPIIILLSLSGGAGSSLFSLIFLSFSSLSACVYLSPSL